jgi:hypothetical protein
MGSISPRARETYHPAMPASVIVCTLDDPDRVHMGDLPTNVELLLAPPPPEPIPDLRDVELIVPYGWLREPLLELLAGGRGAVACDPDPERRRRLADREGAGAHRSLQRPWRL